MPRHKIKNAKKGKYPENLYCDIITIDMADYIKNSNDPLFIESSTLLRNINMALEECKKNNPDLRSQLMLKALIMYYKDGMSMREISDKIGRSNDNVSILIRRMLDRLAYPEYFYIIRHGDLNPKYKEFRQKKDDDNSIDKLNLSTRTYKSLYYSAKIRTINELASKSEDYLLGLDNMGQKTLDEIKEKLASIGLSLTTIDPQIYKTNILELGLEDCLYDKLKRTRIVRCGERSFTVNTNDDYSHYKTKNVKFDTIEDLIKNRDHIDYGDRFIINQKLAPMGLSLTNKIPTESINTDKCACDKKDLLNKLIHELSYEDACKLLLQLRSAEDIS